MDNRKNFLIPALFFVLICFSAISFFIRADKDDFMKRKNAANAIVPLVASKDIKEPDVLSLALNVTRLKTGEVLFSRNADKKRPIASLTKLVSAAVFIDAGGEYSEVEISEDAKKTEEKISKVAPREKLFGRDLLALLLMESANDAALAVAGFVGEKSGAKDFNQTLEIFVSLMNKKAGEIGVASTTRFANPAGLDEENNFSTARDVSLIAEYINEKYSQIWDITRTYETSVFSESGSQYKLINTNILLKEFPAILGGKTGFTDEAKGALLILYALKPDEPISIVILGSEDRFRDARKIIQWLEQKYD